jgi:hypothetical protein
MSNSCNVETRRKEKKAEPDGHAGAEAPQDR